MTWPVGPARWVAATRSTASRSPRSVPVSGGGSKLGRVLVIAATTRSARGRPAPVQRRLARPGPLGDRVHGQPRAAHLGQRASVPRYSRCDRSSMRVAELGNRVPQAARPCYSVVLVGSLFRWICWCPPMSTVVVASARSRDSARCGVCTQRSHEPGWSAGPPVTGACRGRRALAGRGRLIWSPRFLSAPVDVQCGRPGWPRWPRVCWRFLAGDRSRGAAVLSLWGRP